MGSPRPASRRVGLAVALLASALLHAAVLGGAAGWRPRGAAAPDPAPIRVALLPAPAASAPDARVAAVAPPATPARPRPTRAAAPKPSPTADARPGPSTTPDTAASAPLRPSDAGATPGVAVPEPSPATIATGPTASPPPTDVPTPSAPAGEGWVAASDVSTEATDDPRAVAPSRAAASAAPAALPVPPGSVRHRFRVYWGDFADATSVARLEYALTHDGDRYEIRTSAQAEGLLSFVWSGTLSQTSEGRIGPQGLQPVRYVEQRGNRPERTVGFDPDGRRLLPAGGEPVAIPAGTQDRLSVIYQIGLLARGDPSAFVAGAVRELPVATLREVRMERFTVVGDETLMTPGGAVRAVHLRRPPPAGTDDPGIDLWLGYDLGMLPVRLRIEDGRRRVLDQVIETGG